MPGFNLEAIDFDNLETLSEENDQNTLRSTFSEAVKTNPDQHAKQKQISQSTGVPAPAVDDSVEHKFNLDKVNFDDITKRTPKTARYLSNYDNAVIAQDDVDVLQLIEESMTSVKKYASDISKSFEKGQQMVELSELGLIKMRYEQGRGESLTEKQLTRLKELEDSNKTDHTADYGFLSGAPIAAAEQVPIMYEILKHGVGYAGVGAAGGAGVGLLTGPGVVPMAVGGGKIGGRVGVAKGAFDLEAGLATIEFSQLEYNGKRINQKVAADAGEVVGMINAGLEFISLAALGRTVTPAMNYVIKSKVKRALATETGRQMITRLMKDYGIAVATESVTEALQEFTNVLGAELAKSSDKDTFTEHNLSKALDNIFSEQTGERVLEAAKKGAQASLVFAGAGTTASAIAESRRIEKLSADEQLRIDALNESVENSKLRERDKKLFRDFVEQADENDTTVFIDGSQVALYLQGKTPEEIEADPALKLLADQAAEASQLDTDVQINVADFASEIAGTDHYAQLRNSMTMSAETTSPFRQEQVRQETESYVKNMMAEAQESTSEYVEAQEIYTTVRDQLIDTGTVTPANASIMAQIVPAWATTQARRTGKTVQQVYEESGLTIEGPQTGERARLEGEMVLEQVTFEEEGSATVKPGQLGKGIESNKAVEEHKQKIIETGQVMPIEVTKGGFIVDGEHRYKAMLELGIQNIPVYVGEQLGATGRLVKSYPGISVDVDVPKQPSGIKAFFQKAVDKITGKKPPVEEQPEQFAQPVIETAQKNDIGLYSAVEKAVIDMAIPAWKAKPKKVLTDAENTRLNELSLHGITYSSTADPAYKELQELLSKRRQETAQANGNDIWAKLKSSPGIKKEEIEWLGIEEYLKSQDKFTRDEVVEFVRDNGVKIEEVVGAGAEGRTAEFDWQESVWDDPEAWQYRVEDLMYEYDQGERDDRLYDGAVEEIMADEESYIRANFDFEGNDVDPNIEDFSDSIEIIQWIDENFADELRNKYEEAVEKQAEEEYMQYPQHIYYDADSDMYIFGSDELGYMISIGALGNLGEVVGQGDIYSYGEAQIQAEDYAREHGLVADEDSPETARWEEYIMEGYQTNYRELKLTLPDSEVDFEYDVHFPDPNIVAFLRVDDRELAVDPGQDLGPTDIKFSEGKKIGTDTPVYNLMSKRAGVIQEMKSFDSIEERAEYARGLESKQKELITKNTYFIDEFQSDWHQQGRQKGYSTGVEDAGVLDAQADNLIGEMVHSATVIVDAILPITQSEDSKELFELTQIDWGAANSAKNMVSRDSFKPLESTLWGELRSFKGSKFSNKNIDDLFDSVDNNYKEADRLYNQAKAERYGVPDAPFKGDAWMSLGLKRAVIDAIENNYEAIAFADAEVLVDRWSDRYRTLYETQYNKKMPSLLKKLTKTEPVHLALDGTPHEHQELGYWTIPITEELRERVMKESFPLFQKPKKEKARGYFDPANSIIRLTEAADLSTFLHEFAHFMYEMEVNNDTGMLQSINNWYKRNAAAVAAEANTYMGRDFDTLDKAFKNWFGDSKVVDEKGEPLVVYHGTQADFDTFDMSKSVFDGAHFFTPVKEHAQNFGKNIIEGHVKIENPLTVTIDELESELDKDHPNEEYGEDHYDLPRDYIHLFISKAKEEGHDGLIVEGLYDLDFDTDIYIPFEPEQIKSINNQGTFDPADPNILKQDDTPGGTEGGITAADVIRFLDNNSTGDASKDAAIRRAVHEQFARGFEQYLMEGKAPSIELRNAFRAFARWLVQIYKSLVGKLDVNLDDEMRQVFDRLLATEEQIAAAESRARVEPMFTDAAMAGMTEQEFADYKVRQEKVKDVQSETLRDKLIKQLTRQTKAWWKEEKQDIIDEEIEKLNNQKVYVARNRLKDGDVKLDHATVKEIYGITQTNKLGREVTTIPAKLRGMTAKAMEGIHPDEAAALLGYNSGSEMIHDLVEAPNIKDQAEINAEMKMIERHGDILTDGTIEQQADEAVQNEERGKLLLHELKIVSRGTNAPAIERATIKTLAEERIGRLSFREIHPGKYRKAEIRAAQESARMLVEGNKEGAAAAKMRQVMNYYLGMAATKAKNETTDIVNRMARYNKKKVREAIQKVEGGYWDQITRILSRFEFRKSATLKEVESLNTWMKERMETVGDGLVLSNAVLNESYVTHWKNVPFSDLQGINDSVKNIEHVARYADKLTRMQEEITFKKLVEKWTSSMNEKVKTRFKPVASVADKPGIIAKFGRKAMAQMTKIPYLASWLDGGERAGLSHQIMVQPFTEAYTAELKLWESAGKPVMDAIENRSKEDRKRHNTKVFIPEIAGTAGHSGNLMGHEILAVALNTGNQSNLRKLLLGEGWADPENEAEIAFDNPRLQAVLAHMTKSDWELVQQIWDQMETLYPQLAEVHRRTTGLVPPKVEATPIMTPFGEFRGGYYPVKYDPERSFKAALNEDRLNAETESLFSNGASIQASVNTGATNERTGYYAPIRISLNVVPAHFQETIHYITHHDAVREVNRLISNPQIATIIKEKLGPEEYAQLKPWLNDIAKDGREAPTKVFWDTILQRLRFGVTLGTMGFKASTGIIQVSGLSNSIAEVGMGPMMQSMRSILGSTTTMKQAWEFAVENSQVMEHRAQTMDREIKSAMAKIEGKRGLMAAVQEASMKHIALIQTYMVDLPSWHAAYIKGVAEWGDETRAFQYADWVVENVQGSGVTKDMARIMRGQSETGRMFTMFMTFFSSLWNMERDLVKGAKSGRYSNTNVAAKAMFLFTIPVLFEMMMRGELGAADEGDDDERLQKMLFNVALYPTQSIPFIRDIVSATTGEFGYNISPLQMIIEQGTRTIPEVIERGFTDEEITKGQVKGSTKFIGAAIGVPGVNQAWATGEHLYDVMVEGEDFTMHQLLFGPERK